MFPNFKKPKKAIYLDHAATTPVSPGVLKVMRSFLGEQFGNASSLYKNGLQARAAIEGARKTIASIVGSKSSEIIFTAGGTESCNLAIFGVARNFRPTKNYKPHIIVSAVEHHAVLNSAEALKGEGYAVTVLEVNSVGLVDVKKLQKAIRAETVLISIMYANNEIGAIEPIAEIGKAIARINIERSKKNQSPIIFHTDACQGAGSLDLNVNRLSVDLLSANGSKICGPKQTGFLFLRTGINLKPIIYGGGQERNLRSGTENVAGCVGLAKALELSQKFKELENKRIAGLQKYLVSRLIKIQGVALNGPESGRDRLANNINLTIQGVEGEALMLYLDSYGIEVSTGSACTTGLADPSHVLLAIGRTVQEAKSSIRLTLGKSSNKEQLDYAIKVLSPLILELRRVNNFLL